MTKTLYVGPKGNRVVVTPPTAQQVLRGMGEAACEYAVSKVVYDTWTTKLIKR